MAFLAGIRKVLMRRLNSNPPGLRIASDFARLLSGAFACQILEGAGELINLDSWMGDSMRLALESFTSREAPVLA